MRKSVRELPHTVYVVSGPPGVYVGVTSLSVAKRWARHREAARSKHHPGYLSPFLHALRAHGPDSFVVEEVARACDREAGHALEKETIKRLQARGVRILNVNSTDERFGRPARKKRSDIGGRHRRAAPTPLAPEHAP